MFAYIFTLNYMQTGIFVDHFLLCDLRHGVPFRHWPHSRISIENF